MTKKLTNQQKGDRATLIRMWSDVYDMLCVLNDPTALSTLTPREIDAIGMNTERVHGAIGNALRSVGGSYADTTKYVYR